MVLIIVSNIKADAKNKQQIIIFAFTFVQLNCCINKLLLPNKQSWKQIIWHYDFIKNWNCMLLNGSDLSWDSPVSLFTCK